MQILLLGGTGFLGRAITAEALSQGHQVLCLARGNGKTVDKSRFISADRDREDALVPVSGGEWDVIIDLTSHPIHARRAVNELAARHRIYVSTCSVYRVGDRLEQDESAPLVDALEADYMADMNDYGNAKVTCEDIYRQSGASHTIIRPGLIGGYEDETGRSGYYPWRFAHPTGKDVLVPDLSFPVAMIDVEDLAAWIIHCAQARPQGTFNATGVTTDLAQVIGLAQEVAKSSLPPRVVSDRDLQAAGVTSWMGPRSLPLWIDDPDFRFFATLATTKARSVGLKLRPLRETLSAALRYEECRSAPRRAGLSDADEVRLRRSLD